MKSKIIFFLICFVYTLSVLAQKTNELNGKYLKVPVYTNFSEILLINPTSTEGSLAYNLETHSFWFYNGTNWTDLSNGFNIPLDISSNATTLQSTATGSTGAAGVFKIDNVANDYNALTAFTTGTGKALKAFTSGNDNAVEFAITNNTNSNSVLYATTNGSGKAILGQNTGTGNAATFEIQNSGNSSASLFVTTNGTGFAIDASANSGTAARFSSTSGYALTTNTGNVGIGTNTPTTKLEVNGATKISTGNLIVSSGNVGIGSATPTLKLEVNGNAGIQQNNFLEFGQNIIGKETNAGKLGYGLFTANTLDIIGAGTSNVNRKIKLWAEGGATIDGFATITDHAYINSYTRLGNDVTAPSIKMKLLTTTSSGSNSGTIFVAHGLDASKIVSVSVNIEIFGNGYVPPAYDNNSNWKYNFYYDSTNFNIINQAASCATGAHICNKPVTILVTYKE